VPATLHSGQWKIITIKEGEIGEERKRGVMNAAGPTQRERRKGGEKRVSPTADGLIKNSARVMAQRGGGTHKRKKGKIGFNDRFRGIKKKKGGEQGGKK